jgi:tetratricopeptide (TPR) repeat protein
MEVSLPSNWPIPEPFESLQVVSSRADRAVLRVRHRSSGRELFLKILAATSGGGEKQALQEEYLLLDRIRHPNWVRARGYRLLPDGAQCFLLDPAPGRSLAELDLPTGWNAPKNEIARQILSGLDALHSLGHGHLDLKPEHVFIDISGAPEGAARTTPETPAEKVTVTLLDLGLAARFGAPVSRGTLRFVAPEMARGHEWDQRTDLYGFGMILHRLLTNEEIFPGSTDFGQLEARLVDVVSGLEAVSPVGFRTLLQELLSTDPAERPATAREVWRRLKEIRFSASEHDGDAQLTPVPNLAFQGREEEIDHFLGWIRGLEEAAGAEACCRIRGEAGIGKRSLAGRFHALGQTRGWEPAVELAAPDSTPAADDPEECELVYGARQDGKRRVRLRIRTITERPRQCGTDPVSSDDAGSLTISLEKLNEEQLAAIVAPVFDSAPLARRLAQISVGNPGLLCALASEVPPSADLINRSASTAELDLYHETEVRPAFWVEWVRDQLAEVSRNGRNAALLVALSASRFPQADVIQASGLTPLKFSTELHPLFERRLLHDRAGTTEFVSPLWSWAVRESDPGRSRKIGSRLLGRPLPAGEEIEIACAELAVEIRDWKAAGRYLERALDHLLRRELLERALRLLGRAVDSGTGRRGLVSDELLRRIAEASFPMGRSGGALLPRVYRRRPPVGCTDRALSAVLRGWALVGAGEYESALSMLGTSKGSATNGGGFPQICVRAQALRGLGRADDLESELKRYREELPEDDARTLLRTDLLELDVLMDRFPANETRRRLVARSGELSLLTATERGHAAFVRGRLAFASGELAEAEKDFREAEGLWGESDLLRHLVLQSLCGVAYEEGKLNPARDLSWQLIPRRLRLENWGGSANQFSNLAVIELERGQLGTALDAIRRAKEMAIRSRSRSPWNLARATEGHVLVRTGSCTAAREVIQEALVRTDRVHRPALRQSLGESWLYERRHAEGRWEMRQALEGFQELEAHDQATELVVDWLQTEIDLDERVAALRLFEELKRFERFATPRIQTKMLLAEADMVSRDWIAAGEMAEEILLDILIRLDPGKRGLDGGKRGLDTWRGRWNLGRFYARQGEKKQAAEEFENARRELSSLAESLGDPRRIRAFLSLPAPSSFGRQLNER